MKPQVRLIAMLLFGSLPFATLADDTGKAPAAESTPGQYVDDAAITAKVKSAFVRDDQVNALDVKVSTNKGVVQLSGFADNKKVIARAGEIAGSVKGVKAVKNDLRLKE